MALLLCEIITGTIRDVHLQHATVLDYITLLSYFEIYSYVCFLMQMIQITRTLTLMVVYFALS